MKQVYPISIQSGASQTGNYILMLHEPEAGVEVPIIIGQGEAQSILLAKEEVRMRRPLTHELMKHLMEAYGLSLTKVTIDRVVEGVFYATLHVSDGFNEKTIDSRTTDAVTLALHCDAPIWMEEQVLAETGVKTEHTEGGKERTMTEEELEEELRRCEEREDYERAAKIHEKLKAIRHEL